MDQLDVTRKIYPQPRTQAGPKEYFVSVIDSTRKLFDLQGPVTDDRPVLRKIADANSLHGNHWYVCATREGPCLAGTLQSDIQHQFADHMFVENAMSAIPVQVCTKNGWLVP